ncbi:MAG: alpha/beta fold hydrolase [Thermoanaerobaculia bacterium]|nr:alpha/beta fold hydrolase [Thermoanaerobaculia bacterium]
MSRASTRILRIAVVLGVLLLLLGSGSLMIGSVVRSMVYPTPGVPVPSPPPDPLEEVVLEDDGRTVHAWWSPAPGEPTACLLLFHGNGENLETMRMSGVFQEYRRLEISVLVPDYPGYGRSEGPAREDKILSAASVAWAELLQRAGSSCPRILGGWSLGAAVAIQTAARDPAEVDGLILMSSWNRLAEVAKRHFPGWMVGSLLPERYDSLEAAERWSGPSLVIHGERDRIVPMELGRELFETLPEPKRWLAVPGAGHNDLLGREAVWEAQRGFLSGVSRRSGS